MLYTTLFSLVILAVSAPVQSAPYKLTTRQADNVAKENSLAAQKQNLDFATKKAADACQNGEIACVEFAFAQCINNKWVLTKCATGSCLAVPETSRPGTALVCEPPAIAATRFVGVFGGVDGKGTSTPTNASPVAPSPTSPAPSSEPSATPETDDPEFEEGDREELQSEDGEEECEEEDPEELEECYDEDDPANQSVGKRQVVPLQPLPAEPSLVVDPSGGIPPLVPTLVPASPTPISPVVPQTVVPLQPLSSPAVPVSGLAPAPSANPSAISPIPSPVSAGAAATTITVTQVVTVTVTQDAQSTPSGISQRPVASGSAIVSTIPSVTALPPAPSIESGSGTTLPTGPIIIPFQIISGSAPAPSVSSSAHKGFFDLDGYSTKDIRVANPTPTPAPFPTLDKEAFESMLTAAVTA